MVVVVGGKGLKPLVYADRWGFLSVLIDDAHQLVP